MNTHKPSILALDIGSSSVRALLYDQNGTAHAGIGAQEAYALQATTAGQSTADPAELIARVVRCIDTVLHQAGALAHQIAAVAVDTLATTFLALDAAGRPLTPLITYADTRNAATAAHLRTMLDEATVQQRTGCLLRTSYWPARLAWLKQTQPACWRTAAHFVTCGEYLERQLFGQQRVSYSIAAWSGLLDRHTLTWDQALLHQLGVAPEQLAPLVDVDAPLTGLLPAYATRWPSLRGVPWFPAIGDGAAANVGSGCTTPHRIALTMGTTGAIRTIQPNPTHVPAGLWCYRVDRQHALLGGATSEGGNVYAWLRKTLNLDTAAALEATLAATQPDAHGLTILPFFAGERSPNWAGNVPASIHGLTLATPPSDIVRASLEAVAYRFALIHQRITTTTPASNQRLIASGSGLLSSPTWMHIFADVLGCSVVASAEPEATSRGSALLALRSLGLLPTLAAAPRNDGPVYEPDPARHAIYQAAIMRQQWLYERLIQ
jgi:gluconokinase